MNKVISKFNKLKAQDNLPTKDCVKCNGTNIVVCNNCLGIIDDENLACEECNNTGVIKCNYCVSGKIEMDFEDFESVLEDLEDIYNE
jgi:hypothetical protein